MQRIFRLNENDNLVVDINTNRKVNIQIGGEEINFFLGNPAFNDAEMEYMLNFLKHELADSMAHKIHKEIGVLVGHSTTQVETITATTASVAVNLFGEDASTTRIKRPYSKRKYSLKLYYIQIFDKNWVCVFERTNSFRTQEEARKYCYGIIDEMGKGMRSRIKIKKM